MKSVNLARVTANDGWDEASRKINANFLNLYQSIASDAKSGSLIDTAGISAQVVPVVMELVDDEIATAVGQEEQERISQDSVLQAAIQAEAQARGNADDDLQDQIDDEVSTRQAADTLIGEALQQETDARQVVEEGILEDLSALESTLTQAIDSEASTRGAVDQVLQNQINDVEDGITALDNRVGFAEQDIDSIEGDVSNLSSDIASLDTQVAGLSSSMTSLGSRVTDVESDVSDLASDVGALDAEVDGISARLELVEDEATDLRADLAAEASVRAANDADLQDQIDALQPPGTPAWTRLTSTQYPGWQGAYACKIGNIAFLHLMCLGDISLPASNYTTVLTLPERFRPYMPLPTEMHEIRTGGSSMGGGADVFVRIVDDGLVGAGCASGKTSTHWAFFVAYPVLPDA